jgi:probable rRNA maturation factor
MAVSFSYADRRLALKNKSNIKLMIAQIFDEEGKDLADLSFVFCSDEYLLDINQRFLQHDYYTDIISFDLTGPESKSISAEVYVSVDRVKENAILNGNTFFSEMLRVLFHGALHLCGYKDKRKSEIKAMRDREDHYLRLFGKRFA